jgi:hypothetical protein
MEKNKQDIIDFIETKTGKIPRVSSEIKFNDKLGAIKIRLGIKRDKYKVDPGLYAIGSPDENSVVLVSANYKLSFDVLRSNLSGLDAWILVLDTKGINVWCAAGKGTFGTNELVERIEKAGLKNIVNSRKLILPQLGAVGVAAHEVKKLSEFTVVYGPVRALDLRKFLNNNMSATPDMRKVRFTIFDRVILVPMEMVIGAKYLLIAIAILFLLSGLNSFGYSIKLCIITGGRAAINLLFAYLAGTLIGPVLLPWIPGRSFSLKGFLAGIIFFIIIYINNLAGISIFEKVAWLLMIPMIASFMTMNFTGASTFTSLSGVRKEMRIAVPVQLTATSFGIILWLVGRFM